MKKIVFLFLICLFSQNTIVSQVIVTGVVSDSLQIPISYSKISMVSLSDSSKVICIANKDGIFKSELKKGHQWQVVFSALGFEQKEIKLSSDANIELGIINLTAGSIKIKEVTVKAERKIIERKFDRTVFSISQELKQNATTVYDLLAAMPGVIVNQDGSVLFQGASAKILIDNQPAELLYQNLSSISINQVDKIELIDTSNRYGGVKGGTINLRLKARPDKLSGSIYSAERTDFNQSMNRSTLNLNYKYKKNTFINNTTSGISNIYTSSTSSGTISNGNLVTKFSNNQLSNSSSISPNMNLMDLYQIDTCSNILFGVGQTWQKQLSRNDINETMDNPSQIYNELSKSIVIMPVTSGGFYYQNEFDKKGKELQINAWYGQSKVTIDVDKNLSSPQNLIISDDKTSHQKDYFSSLNYNNPFTPTSRWNLYATAAYHQDSDIGSYKIDNTIQPTLNREDRLKMFTASMSNSYGFTIKKIQLDINLALYAKNIHNSGVRNAGTDFPTVNKWYVNAVPSLNINYNLSQSSAFKIKYARELTTPMFYQLLYYVDKQDPYNWSTGNSKLKATIGNAAALSYTYMASKTNFSADVYYRSTKNEIVNINYYYGNGVYIDMIDNVGITSDLGVYLTYWKQITPKFSLNIYSIIHQKISSTAPSTSSIDGIVLNTTGNSKQQNFGYIANVDARLTLFKDYKTILTIKYNGSDITFNSKVNPWLSSSFRVSKLFFNSKLLTSIGAENFTYFLYLKRIYTTNYLGQNSTKHLINGTEKTMLRLELRYTFNSGDRGTKDLKFN